MTYTSRAVYEYISRKTNDPIVERKICTISGQEFAIYQSDLDFYTKISPSFAGEKLQVPTPTLCPEERQRRRLLFRNERKLYKRKCDLTGKNIISIYSPESTYTVYDQKIWRSDQWYPMDYGRDFDFSRSFTEQFGELIKEVPRPNLLITSSENCDYTNHSYYNKDCYLLFGAIFNQNCSFSDQIANSTDCFDCRVCEKANNCYFCLSCANCNNLFYSISSTNCNFSYGLYDCRNCEFCINCSSLSDKKYCINNKQYTKYDYEKYIKGMGFSNPNTFLSQKTLGSDSCIGDEIHGSTKCLFCFDVYNCNNCKYIRSDIDAVDAMDSYGISKSPLSLECLAVKDLYQSLGNLMCIGGIQLYYCNFCYDSNHLFGCIGLRNKSYCIFNKQYTKEEYEVLVPRIIAHMQNSGERGEFFHPSLSPFGYNETVAQEYFPLTKQEAIVRGYTRQDQEYPVNIPENMQSIAAKDLPSDIASVDDTILEKAILCEVSGKPFRIIKPELAFYRKHGIPLPRKHPDIRHEERMKLRPGRTLFLRNCDCCGDEMVSVYTLVDQGRDGLHPSSKDACDASLLSSKVYCETCYQKEIYG